MGQSSFGLLGYPEAALADAERAVKYARELGQAAALMYALFHTSLTTICSGRYDAANARLNELVALAKDKNAALWNAWEMSLRGWLFSLTGRPADAVETITSALIAQRSTGATVRIPRNLSSLTRAYANLGQYDDAWRSIDEAMTAMETTKEKWWKAEVNRVAGEIALKSPAPHTAKAEEYFERALAVARQQQAKSWELRAAMSLARLWRSRGKVKQARELLAPVYGWFTEGFDTRDLKEAKALLEELQT
jgi:predicted ATPase